MVGKEAWCKSKHRRRIYPLQLSETFSFHVMYLSLMIQEPIEVSLDLPSSWCNVNQITIIKNILNKV